jgi:putative membrane protein
MQVVLALHLIFMVAWFAGLFYLPRLFVYHSEATDPISLERFKVMERRLFYGIMMPALILTAVFGYWTMSYRWDYYSHQNWMHVKLASVLILWAYQAMCWWMMIQFKHGKNRFSTKFYRFFNEVPTVFLILIIFMVVLKP